MLMQCLNHCRATSHKSRVDCSEFVGLVIKVSFSTLLHCYLIFITLIVGVV